MAGAGKIGRHRRGQVAGEARSGGPGIKGSSGRGNRQGATGQEVGVSLLDFPAVFCITAVEGTNLTKN